MATGPGPGPPLARPPPRRAADAEAAILADQRLTDEQKNALITVYRSMLRSE